jgi:Na+/H+ antiporter
LNYPELLIILISAIAVTIFAEHKNLQPPLVVVCIGLLASFMPGLHEFELEPEVILQIVLPPLLFSTALNISFTNFLKRIKAISNLGVTLVIVTTLAVGLSASWIVPGLPLAAALVLGAVIAPPDAVTAAAIGRRLGLPKRVMTILSGESLVNDAAALTLFSITVAAVAGTPTFINNVVLFFLYNASVGVIIGLVVGVIVHWIRVRLQGAAIVTALGIITPFTAFLVAEELHASGVLAVVAAGFYLGQHASQVQYNARLQEKSVWSTIDVLLETFVFAYIGLQLRFVLDEANQGGYSTWNILLYSGLIFLVITLVRLAWVVGSNVVSHWNYKRQKLRFPDKKILVPLTRPESLVVSWTGMRGVVTLAAAAGIPLITNMGAVFPGRAAIQAIAFLVTVGTLLIQGLTLPWLIKRLRVVDPHEAELEQGQLNYAQRVSRKAAAEAFQRIANQQQPEQTQKIISMFQEQVLRNYELRQLLQRSETPAAERQIITTLVGVSQYIVSAQRDALIAERDAEHISEDVLRTAFEQLDLQEAVILNRYQDRL